MVNNKNLQVKREKADEICTHDPLVVKIIPKWRLARAATLYRVLNIMGYTWNVANLEWEQRVKEPDTARAQTLSEVSIDVLKESIQLRLIAHTDDIARHKNLLEMLFDLGEYDIISVSKEYPGTPNRAKSIIYYVLKARPLD